MCLLPRASLGRDRTVSPTQSWPRARQNYISRLRLASSETEQRFYARKDPRDIYLPQGVPPNDDNMKARGDKGAPLITRAASFTDLHGTYTLAREENKKNHKTTNKSQKQGGKLSAF
jgi:hypothetical protein